MKFFNGIQLFLSSIKWYRRGAFSMLLPYWSRPVVLRWLWEHRAEPNNRAKARRMAREFTNET